jgi:hypothetical protein
MKPFIKESLTDTRGYPSSTRVIAYRLALWFFPLFNLLYIGLLTLIIYMVLRQGKSIDDVVVSFTLTTSGFILSLDTLLLGYVFASKRTGKLAETSEIIEIAKATNADPLVEK